MIMEGKLETRNMTKGCHLKGLMRVTKNVFVWGQLRACWLTKDATREIQSFIGANMEDRLIMKAFNFIFK